MGKVVSLLLVASALSSGAQFATSASHAATPVRFGDTRLNVSVLKHTTANSPLHPGTLVLHSEAEFATFRVARTTDVVFIGRDRKTIAIKTAAAGSVVDSSGPVRASLLLPPTAAQRPEIGQPVLVGIPDWRPCRTSQFSAGAHRVAVPSAAP